MEKQCEQFSYEDPFRHAMTTSVSVFTAQRSMRRPRQSTIASTPLARLPRNAFAA
jgi:hypothetical protein